MEQQVACQLPLFTHLIQSQNIVSAVMGARLAWLSGLFVASRKPDFKICLLGYQGVGKTRLIETALGTLTGHVSEAAGNPVMTG